MKRVRLLLSWLLCSVGLPAADPPLKIALLCGDAQSAAALGAVAELQRDPALKHVTVRAYPQPDVGDDDRRFVRESDIVLCYTRYGALIRSLAEELRTCGARGGWVAGIGGALDAEFSDLGIRRDAELAEYFTAGGQANLVQLLRAALARKLRPGLSFAPPAPVPEMGYFEPRSGRTFTDFGAYAAAYRAGRTESTSGPWIGVYFSRDNATSGQTELLSALGTALEARGFGAAFAFGYPPDVAVPALFLDGEGRRRIEALVALTMKIGNVPAKLGPILEKLDVPILNAVALNTQSRRDWENSAVGLDALERSWQLGGAELAGAIAPTVVASKEKLVDAATGQAFIATMPIPERIERLVDRVQAWVKLRTTPAREKRVAVLYYNYPPGRESIGASYLNVLPASLQVILQRLRTDGFDPTGAPETADQLFSLIRTLGSNPAPGPEAAAALDRLARSGHVPLLAVADYRTWFDRLPESLRRSLLAKWGEPEASSVMVWRDDQQRPFFVFPGLRWGNVLFAAQPTRGWDQDPSAVYHDVTLPPHHQYVAFYLWLQREFRADAMVHVGTHATHEWLPGKEVGLGAGDPGEVIVGAVPQLYPYIVDDIGEGLQAKRRGMAAIITHLPPPFDRATLNPQLREISGLIGDLHLAQERGSAAVAEQLRDLTARCAQLGLLTDLSLTLPEGAVLNAEQIEEVEHHLKRIGEKLTPFGLHTFGVSPDVARQAVTAEALLDLEPGLSDRERERRKAELLAALARSGPAEIEALSAGLAGRYIPAGLGNDPVRNPDALPTGKNFYGFDPSRLPTPATYAAGTRLAAELVAGYRQRHRGEFPDRLVFNLWGTETSRHEGAMESQILALMGVRPKWDARGRVQGVELIERAELGRPRVDVTIVPSGLYRDLFPGLLRLLDQAVDVVKTAAEADNPLRRNMASARATLLARGIPAEQAERLAAVRMFSVPSGAYGTGLDHVIQKEGSWDNEQQVADVFFKRMSHLFGQGFWGDQPGANGTDPVLAADVLRLAFSGAKGVVHSRSSNVYGAIDSDDFYQYLGGTALAVRRVNGAGAETLITDLSNPRAGETVTAQRYLGRELRARYLNPKWIEAMLKEGYSGARMVRQVTDNLWGWQVTVPEAVDAAKWQEMFETYVQDRNRLGIVEKFKAAENLAAYRAIVERMMAVTAKGYWTPAPATLAQLRQTLAELAPAVAAEDAAIKARAEQATQRPTVAPAAPEPGGDPVVRGRVLEERRLTGSARTAAKAGADRVTLPAVTAGGVLLFLVGWCWHWRQEQRGTGELKWTRRLQREPGK
jgi:cobaltochelatase CobN